MTKLTSKSKIYNRHIVIFDGVCNFCNGSVIFIINRDPGGVFSFTPIQSDLAKQLIDSYQIDNVGIDTFLLIKEGKCYIGTNAALEIAKDLTGHWYLFCIFKVIPRPIRDFLYRLFARNRYRIFGKREICIVPTQDIIDRFVDI